MKIITTNDGTQYKKPGIARRGAAVTTAGIAASAIVLAPMTPVGRLYVNGVRNLNTNVDKNELRAAIDEALSSSNTGTKILDFSNKKMKSLTPREIQKLYNDFLSQQEKNIPMKEFFNKLKALNKKVTLKRVLAPFVNGNNAGFFSGKNRIFVNVDKFGTAVFHEIGHAINYNSSPFWKVIQKMRVPLVYAPSAFLMVSLFKRKKLEGEEPKNGFDRATDFIKNNAGKLSMLAMVPVIAEELKATLRGNKMARQLCSPDLYKKVVKTNTLGAITYISAALLTGLSVYAAGKIKDSIAKPVKLMENPPPTPPRTK